MLSVALWAASLPLPALELGDGLPLAGWALLVDGWRGTMAGQPGWWANPLLGCALLSAASGRARLALAFAVAAFVAAASVLFASRLGLLTTGATIPKFSFRIGFFLWLTAPLPLLVSVACTAARRASGWRL